MENIFGLSTIPLVQILIEIALFLALTLIGMFIVKTRPKSNSRFFKANEYLPEDEIQTLRQVSYLVMMSACFINMMYPLVFVNTDIIYFTVFDVILSLYLAITMDKSTTLRKLAVLLLVPYGALTFMLFNSSVVGLLDLIHIPVFIYFNKHYYDKFTKYTESQGLGITVVLLFVIIFVSFILTILLENKNPLNAIIMVSNAFTSNGYAILGDSIGGKINSLLLVWSGFIISGVGTATMASAILTRNFKKKTKAYDEKLGELNTRIDEFNDRFDELERLIKENRDD